MYSIVDNFGFPHTLGSVRSFEDAVAIAVKTWRATEHWITVLNERGQIVHNLSGREGSESEE